MPVRLRFAKRGRVRFISHRDVARAFERAFRVAELPLGFTEGFAPRPRVSFGLALPVGYESDAEYLDVELTREVDVPGLADVVSAALPEGLDVTGAALLDWRAGSLQQEVAAVAYRVELARAADRAVQAAAGGEEGAPASEPTLDPSDVGAWVDQALRADRLDGVRRRKGREVVEDLRPAIRELSVAGTTSRGVELRLEVSTQPRATRPSEVIAALPSGGVALAETGVLRTNQWIERDGSRLEPLEADTRVPARAGT